MSELQSRAAEIRQVASECEHLLELSRRLRWSMEIARHANAELNLGLPEAGLKPAGAKVAGVAVPKPTKKGTGK